jgi:hypothetical protein
MWKYSAYYPNSGGYAENFCILIVSPTRWSLGDVVGQYIVSRKGFFMSSSPYYYFTQYQEDVNAALQDLRQREFEAGRYDPAMYMNEPSLFMSNFQFPPDESSIAPGAKHSSIEEAVKAGEACGTGSILDIQRVSDFPEFLASSPLSSEWLIQFLGTDKPGRELVESVIIQEEEVEVWDELADEMGAGGSCYLIVYENDKPSEIFFMGYSID